MHTSASGSVAQQLVDIADSLDKALKCSTRHRCDGGPAQTAPATMDCLAPAPTPSRTTAAILRGYFFRLCVRCCEYSLPASGEVDISMKSKTEMGRLSTAAGWALGSSEALRL